MDNVIKVGYENMDISIPVPVNPMSVELLKIEELPHKKKGKIAQAIESIEHIQS